MNNKTVYEIYGEMENMLSGWITEELDDSISGFILYELNPNPNHMMILSIQNKIYNDL